MRNRMLEAFQDLNRKHHGDFQVIFEGMPISVFTEVRDTATKDPDCVSIQKVTEHVVSSGHSYANYIFSLLGESRERYAAKIESPTQAVQELSKMLQYLNGSLEAIIDQSDEALEAHQIVVRWGPTYGVEALLEHALVHVLRHARQVENWLAAAR